jgi:hypothetical protein
MIFLTEENDLNLNDRKVALYFYASWMPFNKKMLLMISKIEEKHKDIIFYAIDTDFFKNLCTRFKVEEIPTVILFKNKEIKRITGVSMTSAFKNAFNDI